MISVLICSTDPVLLQNVLENIDKTMGVPFEILYLDNRTEKKGICEVYNELAQQAQFPYLCFLHEDVIMKTKNWGKVIVGIFLNDGQAALIGIAGCKYKSDYFSGWFSNRKELDCANYTHQYKSGIEKVHLSPTDDHGLQEVVCIDGVFMCCRKEAWRDTRFDDVFLKGFHFYDIDFSMRLARQHKVLVTYDIELIHITSGGDYGNKWVTIAISYHQNRKPVLPFSKIPVDRKMADRNIVTAYMDFLKNYDITFNNKIKWVVLQKLHLFPVYYFAIMKFFLIPLLRNKKN